MELRSCRAEERLDALRLSRSVFKDNMAEQFPILLGPGNEQRMFVALDAGKVVAMVNYYPTPVAIGPATIHVASIGSVCTDPAYRGQKLASRLLLLADAAMAKEAVDTIVISGGGGIYDAFGSALAGDMREVLLAADRLLVPEGLGHTPYEEEHFSAIRTLYDREPVRYLRGEEEFKLLIRGQTYPDTYAEYPLEVILDQGVVVAYAVLELHHDNDELGVKEYAGDRRVLQRAFRLLAGRYGRKTVHFASLPGDGILAGLPATAIKAIDQYASLKVRDFALLMDRLQPRTTAILGPAAAALSFTVEGSAAVLSGYGQSLRIEDPRQLAKLVFGAAGPTPTSATGAFAAALDRIFPVPFPWTHSLNYQ